MLINIWYYNAGTNSYISIKHKLSLPCIVYLKQCMLCYLVTLWPICAILSMRVSKFISKYIICIWLEWSQICISNYIQTFLPPVERPDALLWEEGCGSRVYNWRMRTSSCSTTGCTTSTHSSITTSVYTSSCELLIILYFYIYNFIIIVGVVQY